MGGLSTGVRSSPLPSPTPNHLEKRSAKDKGSKFLRRLIHVRHMDFQFAMWQMLYLFVSPQKVYRNFQYRKQTKDQFARDDPAFLVLLGLWLVASSVGFVLILRISFLGFLKFLLWVIFIDCIGMGVLVATGLCALAPHLPSVWQHPVADSAGILHLHHIPWLQCASYPQEYAHFSLSTGPPVCLLRSDFGVQCQPL